MTELAASSPSAEPRRAAPALAFMLPRRATANFLEDRASQLAAGISYFALFSLFPFTLLVFAVFGLVLRDDDLQADVLSAVVDAIPIEDDFIADALDALAEQGATIGAFALLGTLWSASALATALRSALNVAFEVEQRRPLLRGKLIDFTVLPALGAALPRLAPAQHRLAHRPHPGRRPRRLRRAHAALGARRARHPRPGQLPRLPLPLLAAPPTARSTRATSGRARSSRPSASRRSSSASRSTSRTSATTTSSTAPSAA